VEAEGVAVVTGASRGLGRAVALELARAGFDTVATMRDPVDGAGLAGEAAQASGRLAVERLDVTEPDTIRLPGDLRVLVNNAGVERAHLPFENTPLSLWREMLETNVFGVIEVTRRAVPIMRQGGGGVICNVTSSSLFAPVPFYAPYRASKAAVSALGESLRTELVPFGIRVLEVVPGPIDTDMLRDSGDAPAAGRYEPYRGMAQRAHRGRLNVAGSITSPAEAARRIVDAILDDDAPLRCGCDPLGTGLLDAWRRSPDEELMCSMLPTWIGPPSGSAPEAPRAGKEA
jgi:NAD(P)-dependent dehydrogenase (short-subunit alcohol dehydrogenase family)